MESSESADVRLFDDLLALAFLTERLRPSAAAHRQPDQRLPQPTVRQLEGVLDRGRGAEVPGTLA